MLSNGWVLLGEVNKFVPISNQRIVSLTESTDGIAVTVTGAAHETVAFAAVDYKTTPGAAPTVMSGTFGPDATPITLTFTHGA